jgi:hypothetical protein
MATSTPQTAATLTSPAMTEELLEKRQSRLLAHIWPSASLDLQRTSEPKPALGFWLLKASLRQVDAGSSFARRVVAHPKQITVPYHPAVAGVVAAAGQSENGLMAVSGHPRPARSKPSRRHGNGGHKPTWPHRVIAGSWVRQSDTSSCGSSNALYGGRLWPIRPGRARAILSSSGMQRTVVSLTHCDAPTDASGKRFQICKREMPRRTRAIVRN